MKELKGRVSLPEPTRLGEDLYDVRTKLTFDAPQTDVSCDIRYRLSGSEEAVEAAAKKIAGWAGDDVTREEDGSFLVRLGFTFEGDDAKGDPETLALQAFKDEAEAELGEATLESAEVIGGDADRYESYSDWNKEAVRQLYDRIKDVEGVSVDDENWSRIYFVNDDARFAFSPEVIDQLREGKENKEGCFLIAFARDPQKFKGERLFVDSKGSPIIDQGEAQAMKERKKEFERSWNDGAKGATYRFEVVNASEIEAKTEGKPRLGEDLPDAIPAEPIAVSTEPAALPAPTDEVETNAIASVLGHLAAEGFRLAEEASGAIATVQAERPDAEEALRKLGDALDAAYELVGASQAALAAIDAEAGEALGVGKGE